MSVWCWTGVSQQVKRTKRCRRAATPDSRCSQSATVTWNFDNKDRDTEAVRKSRENSTRRYPSGVIAGIAADFGDLGRLQLRGAHWKSSQVKASLGSWSIFSISSPPFFELPVCLVCVGVGVHTHTIPAPAPAPSHSRSLSLVRRLSIQSNPIQLSRPSPAFSCHHILASPHFGLTLCAAAAAAPLQCPFLFWVLALFHP